MVVVDIKPVGHVGWHSSTTLLLPTTHMSKNVSYMLSAFIFKFIWLLVFVLIIPLLNVKYL